METQDTGKKLLGLIVNPVAGVGGRVGLKGSDGHEIQERAMLLGATPHSGVRAAQALEELCSAASWFDLVTYPDEMGEAAARNCGLLPIVIGSIRSGSTTSEDTRRAARAMRDCGVDLLLFAGGDGTARDVLDAVGDTLTVLGIPAGVKMHSAVFATSPRNAGRLVALHLAGLTRRVAEAEVMDLDEDAFREGMVSPRLYGYLAIPLDRHFVQCQKTASLPSEAAMMAAIAFDVVEAMKDDWLYIVGPGTTTRAISTRLGFQKTLVGVDVVSPGGLVAADVNEAQLLKISAGREAMIIVTPVGGQGYLFGRGNQQISSQVIRRVGKENILVVSTIHKLSSLGGRPLLVDTGDPQVDAMLTGYLPVITGYRDRAIYRVSS